mgnify:CR=1 FL=1
MDNKNKYIKFCHVEKQIPIFSQPWWLDVVCGKDNWDVILVSKGSDILATFPYYIQRNRGMTCICMPTLTQKLGPYIKYPERQKYTSRLSYERDVMQDIIKQLPSYDVFSVNFDYKYTNWLPFYWNQFKQTTRYTYIIENILDIDSVVKNFDSRKKSSLKKGMGNLNIRYDLSSTEFITFYQTCLKKKGKHLSYSSDLFCNVCKAAYNNEQGRIVCAVDDEDRIHGAIFYVWDDNSAYVLVTAFDSECSSDAPTLLIYQLIKDSSTHSKVFDFEGSMIDGVELSYRRFGTIQKPYFYIYRYASKKCRILKGLKCIIDAIKN